MADVQFRFLPERRPVPALWAARTAVTQGVFGAAAGSDDPVVLLPRVEGIWRRQVSELGGCGWEPARGVGMQWVRNCPPFGHPVEPVGGPADLRPCHLHHICPWCWGRRVVAPAFDTTAAALEAKGCALPLLPSGEFPYRIVSVRYLIDLPDTDDHLGCLQGSREATKRICDLWMDAGCLGGCWVTTVYPRNGVTRADGRLLMVAPRRAMSVEKPGGHPEQTRFESDPDVTALVWAASRFGRYPGRLLTGPVKEVAALLAARARTPRARYYGTVGICYGIDPGQRKSKRQDNSEE